MKSKKASKWVELAKQAFDISTSFVDANYRKQWENNIRHFQSRHHLGSKYNTALYKYRSKIFRPKTRAMVRSHEAAAMVAFFSNPDVVSIQAYEKDEELAKLKSEFFNELINYRLTKTIPWFRIIIGALQEAIVTGVCCSFQYWAYEEKKINYENALTVPQVIKDTPWIELIPVENMRFHPAADWLNPVNSSPFLIRMIPMYVQDVMKRMDQKEWIKYSEGEIKSAIVHQFDSTRLVRQGEKQDPYQNLTEKGLSLYDVVWVHENIINIQGQDYHYYTLGTEYLLSNPVPIEMVYPIGERPFVVGFSQIEAFKAIPPSLVELTSGIQKELNEVVNQRLDNVKLVLNKRWTVRRGSQVDIQSLLRNVPGSVTLVNNHDDIHEWAFPDVTTSSYMEQDRLNVDFDELSGSFSVSTIQTNRRLNETVGGLSMLRGTANLLTEYLIRTFAETWVEPVIRQIVKLEQLYESNIDLIQRIAERVGIENINPLVLFEGDLDVGVNVGLGSTDPMLRVNNFMLAVNSAIEVMRSTPPGTLNVMEVVKEIFGKLGYKNPQRFIEGNDLNEMEKAQLIQVINALQAQLQDKQADRELKLLLQHMKEKGQDRRKLLDAEVKLETKKMDLLNPVVGEV